MLRDPDGLAFRINDPPFVIAEIEYDYNRDHRLEENNPNQIARAAGATGRAGAKCGRPDRRVAWWLAWWITRWITRYDQDRRLVPTGEFADPRFDTQGGIFAVTGGTPAQHAGDFSVYGIVDQMLWRATLASSTASCVSWARPTTAI